MSLFIFNITIALILLPENEDHACLVNKRKVNLDFSWLSVRNMTVSKLARSSDIVIFSIHHSTTYCLYEFGLSNLPEPQYLISKMGIIIAIDNR